MEVNQKQIDQIISFKNRDKLTTKSWADRGINPSLSVETIQKIEFLFNSCADNLIIALNQNASNRKLKSILKEGLSAFNKSEYDTEEKEFICEIFSLTSRLEYVKFFEILDWPAFEVIFER